MFWRMVTMVFKPFTRRNKKNLAFFSSYECFLSKATGNSDSQRLQYYNGHNSLLILLNGLIDAFEVFCMCTGSVSLYAQAHH